MQDISYPSPESDGRSCTPPTPLGDSQLPKHIRPTILMPQKHPLTDEVVKEVNDFFLENWPFRTEKHRARFVKEGYAWVLCLYAGFLIDDLLDRMSMEEGVAFNETIIQCCKSEVLPDRSVPAQWIMYDLFNEMRALDKPLADALLEHTIDFLRGQVNKDRSKPMDLQEYFVLRNDDLGK